MNKQREGSAVQKILPADPSLEMVLLLYSSFCMWTLSMVHFLCKETK